MESINVFKGYGKVNSNLENQNPHPHHHNHSRTTRKTLFIISAILLLTLVISLMLAALIHESNDEPSESEELVESIRAVCNVTQYPASCFTSISSANISTKSDPEAIFKLSLQISIKELKNISSQFKRLKDINSQAAIDDCLTQFEDASSRLNDSVSAMEVGSGEKALTTEKIYDIQTWISAAMTDQQTCLDGLEEMGSKTLYEVKAKMKNSNEFLSNSLAIVAQMNNLLKKFDLKMH